MNADTPPDILLSQISRAATGVPGNWRIVWRVQNVGNERIQIISVRLPHGQFKSDEQRFEPPILLAIGGNAEFDCTVRCSEPVGLVTENAFVIFYANWLGADWRIYVRIRVTMNSESQPETATESITYQKAGFSGVAQ